jgi:hypothetical protein
MSIDFITNRRDIPFNELVPRLAHFGITEKVISRINAPVPGAIFLTDGVEGGLWVEPSKDRMLGSIDLLRVEWASRSRSRCDQGRVRLPDRA